MLPSGASDNPLNKYSAEQIARAGEALRRLAFESSKAGGRKYDRDEGGKFAEKDSGDKSGQGGKKKAPKNRVKKAEEVPAEVGALPGKTGAEHSLPGRQGEERSLPGTKPATADEPDEFTDEQRSLLEAAERGGMRGLIDKIEEDEKSTQGVDRLVNEQVDRSKQIAESEASEPDRVKAELDKSTDKGISKLTKSDESASGDLTDSINEAVKGQKAQLAEAEASAKDDAKHAAEQKRLNEDEFLKSAGFSDNDISGLTEKQRQTKLAAVRITKLVEEANGNPDPFAVIGEVDPATAASLGKSEGRASLKEIVAQKKADKAKAKAERLATKLEKRQTKLAGVAAKVAAKQKQRAEATAEREARAENRAFDKQKVKENKAIAGLGGYADQVTKQAEKNVAKQTAADEREARAENKARDKAAADEEKAAIKAHEKMGKAEESAWAENTKRDEKARKHSEQLQKIAQRGAEQRVAAQLKEEAKANKAAFKKGQALGKAIGGGLGGGKGGAGRGGKVGGGGGGKGVIGKGGALMPAPGKANIPPLSKKDANILKETIRRLTQREPNRLLDLIHGEITKRVQNAAGAPVMQYAAATVTAALEKGAGVKRLAKTYTTVYEANGTVRVKDVPIFAENKRKFGEMELCYDRAWLEGAMAVCHRKRDSGYMAPMHFGHHERGSVRKRAGHFEQTGVYLCDYHGEPKWVTFADLVYSSEENFEKAKKDYPYRSVEISPDRPNEINSLALLSSEAPYFQFPNLAFSATQGEERVFVWSDNAMADDAKNKPADNVTAATTEGTTQFAPPPMQPMNPPQAATPPAAAPPPAIQAAAPAAPVAAPAAPAAPPAPAVNPTDQKLDQVLNLLSTLIDALTGGGDEQPVVQASAEESSEDTRVEAVPVAPVTETASSSTNVSVTFSAGDNTMSDAKDKASGDAQAKLEGEIAGLKAKLAAYEKAENDAKLFSVLMAELKGFATSPAIETDLKQKIAETGETAARAYVAGIKQVAPKLPPATSPEAPASGSPASNDLPEVAKYAAKGPEVLAEARRFSALFDTIKDRPALRGKTREQYIDAQFFAFGG